MRKKVICFSLSGLLIFESLIACAFMSAVPVLALSVGGLQSTIASLILSLLLQCGVAPTNQAWLTALNNSYGVESSIGTIQDCINNGLLTQTATGLVDTGLSTAIANQTAYTELGLAEMFATTADDAATGLVVAGSGAVNLAGTAINVGTLGTIGAFAGAAAIGVGLGFLINHVRESLTKYVRNGAPVDPESYIGQYLTDTSKLFERVFRYPGQGVDSTYANVYEGGNLVGLINIDTTRNNYRAIIANLSTTEDSTGKEIDVNNKLVSNTRLNKNGTTTGTGSSLIKYRGYIYIDNWDDRFQILDGIKNGTISVPGVVAPDLIGSNGNLTDDNGDIGLSNQVPEGYDMKPVDMNDYQNFANDANDNTDNGMTAENGDLFDNLIEPLMEEPSLVPDQGTEVPDVPNHPVIPDQPTVPGKDPITGEEQAEVLQGITTPDLRAVFPFCIPFDLYNALLIVQPDGREAPVIIWEMPIGDNWTIVLDFSEFDEVAALLRKLELILFIIGLAVATRYLIGAT